MKSAEHAIDLESALETLNTALQMRLIKNNYNSNPLYSGLVLENMNTNSFGQLDLFSIFEDIELG